MITSDYIRGLIDGEGCFTFHTNKSLKDGKIIIRKIPAFLLQMHERDEYLVTSVRDFLKLKNKVYSHKLPNLVAKISGREKVYKRGKRSSLYVRDIGSLKNIIVPFFYKKLIGFKGFQLKEWIENIGNDENVPDSYKLIYKLFKSGYYD